MKTDSLFYRLFQRNPQLVMELLGLEFRGDSYRFGSEEIKQTAFRIDGVFTPLTNNPKQPLIFTEVQYQPDDDFYGRFFSEITLYLYREKTEKTWLALVIYPTRTVEKTPKADFEPFMQLPQLHRIYLEDYQDGALSLNLQLIRLITCHENQAEKLARALVQQHKLDNETMDFIETILVYKLTRLSREEIRKMLNIQDVRLKDTRFYQEIEQEVEERLLRRFSILQEGEAKQTRFYQEAWTEGRQNGRQEGELLLLQRMLVKRFGQLPDSIQQRLQLASLEQIEHWSDRLLDAATLEAVFNPN